MGLRPRKSLLRDRFRELWALFCDLVCNPSRFEDAVEGIVGYFEAGSFTKLFVGKGGIVSYDSKDKAFISIGYLLRSAWTWLRVSFVACWSLLDSVFDGGFWDIMSLAEFNDASAGSVRPFDNCASIWGELLTPANIRRNWP